MDNLSAYDYQLPPELIADTPLPQRDASRLLEVDRTTGAVQHRTVADLPELLRPADCLVLNDTKVIPARLLGRRAATGGRWEGLYLGSTASGVWRLIGQTRGKLHAGEQIVIRPAHDPESGEELRITLLDSEPDGVWLAEPLLRPPQGARRASEGFPCLRGGPGARVDVLKLLDRFGTVPLPPYIRRTLPREIDRQRYQTSFARRPGAVAAPTAGLHFTPQLLARCRQRGIRHAFVTLHVGLGTFRPITVDRLSAHRMHAEWCELPATTAELLNRTRGEGGRIVAVGTTTVRTLESVVQTGPLRAWRGETDLFIRPPYEFRAVDGLLTNFHLPLSTLFVLVCAFAGTERIKRAYAAAIEQRYRFYSYGDAMLIL